MTEKNPRQPPKRRFSSSRTLSLGEPPINHNCLQDHPFFKERDPKLFELLLEHVNMQVFRPGDTIIKQGEEANCMYFLNRGEVEVLIGPEEKQVAKMGDGDLFGEMALLGQGKRAATVRAVQFCDCRSLDIHAFQICLLRFPKEKTYFHKLAADRIAARKNVEVYVDAKPVDKLRKSVNAVRSMMRMKAKFQSCPPLSETDSLGQEEELPHPLISSAAISTGFAADVSEASGEKISQDMEMLVELPSQPKKRTSMTWHKRKFMSNQESTLCYGSERSSYGVDRLSYEKDRCTSITQSTDCPDDLRLTTCTVTSQSTDCPDDKWPTEPSERLSFTAVPGAQITNSRPMDPMCQEVQDKPGSHDAADREASSGQGNSLSNRFDAAKYPLRLILKPKYKSANYQDPPDPLSFAKPILADAGHCEKLSENGGKVHRQMQQQIADLQKEISALRRKSADDGQPPEGAPAHDSGPLASPDVKPPSANKLFGKVNGLRSKLQKAESRVGSKEAVLADCRKEIAELEASLVTDKASAASLRISLQDAEVELARHITDHVGLDNAVEVLKQNCGSGQKRRSWSCTAAHSGPQSYLPRLKTTDRAMASWWRTQP